MPLKLRRFARTAHIAVAVGWLGAVAGFLALAVAGFTSADPQIARAAYIAMGLIAWPVIVPLSLAALLTGLIQALGTRWGLFRHYWIVIKLAITGFAVIALLIHLQPISLMADAAARGTSLAADLGPARFQLLIAPALSVLVLLVPLTLAVYKPRGLTQYGRRK
jgi:hypothetical protein